MRKLYSYLDPAIQLGFQWPTTQDPEDFSFLLEAPKKYPFTPQENQYMELLRRWRPKNILGILNTHIGIEVEIEGITKIPKDPELNKYWIRVQDGSLRNNGFEFVTPRGFRVHSFRDAWNVFFNVIFGNNPNAEFSERTSIHIHTDVRLFNEQQLRNLLACYTVIESGLFSFCDESRKKNIFCLPLIESALAGFQADLINATQAWEKYTAFNLRPCTNYGTVEFRHLHGTFNYYELLLWICALTNLIQFIKFIPTADFKAQLRNLKYKSEYEQFITNIFGELRHAFRWNFDEIDEAASFAKTLYLKSSGETL